MRFSPEHRANSIAALPRGKKHPAWKGEGASYSSIHEWVRRHKTKTGICSRCKRRAYNGYTEWANIDHKYRRVLEDYIEVCKSCHKYLDAEIALPTRSTLVCKEKS